jgi:hypothetical protein
LAANLAVFHIDLAFHRGVQDHRNLFPATWARKEVFHSTQNTRLARPRPVLQRHGAGTWMLVVGKGGGLRVSPASSLPIRHFIAIYRTSGMGEPPAPVPDGLQLARP